MTHAADAVVQAPKTTAVCVCTKGRPQMLRRCLQSLRRQQFDAADLRMIVVVVDNDLHAPARGVFEEMFSGANGDRYVHCPTPGIPFARNAALETALEAGADYIAFIDDDEIAPEDWLGAMVRALCETGADAVQGGVIRVPPGGDTAAPPANSREAAFEAVEMLATCNTIFRARLAAPPLALRFDEAMRFSGGSDRDFFMRAHKRGAKNIRAHGIDVVEEVAPGRESLRYECERAFASGNNYYVRMLKNEPFPRGVARIVLRAIERSVSGLLKLLFSALAALALQHATGGRLARTGCAHVCFALGCLSPALGIRAHPYRTVQGI